MWFTEMQRRINELEDSPRKANWQLSLTATWYRTSFVGYHRDAYRREIQNALAAFPEADRERMLVFARFAAVSRDDVFRLEQAKFGAMANIIAAAQSLHAACDIFSQVAHYALNLTTPAEKTNIHRIAKISTNVGSKFDALANSPEFEYLSAFVNKNKHVQLIHTPTKAVYTSGEKMGLVVTDFSYYNPYTKVESKFAWKWVDDFVDTECDMIVQHLNGCGEALVDEMKSD